MSGNAVDPNLDPCQKEKGKKKALSCFQELDVVRFSGVLYEGQRIKLQAFFRQKN
jgi:hypothetical protein